MILFSSQGTEVVFGKRGMRMVDKGKRKAEDENSELYIGENSSTVFICRERPMYSSRLHRSLNRQDYTCGLQVPKGRSSRGDGWV